MDTTKTDATTLPTPTPPTDTSSFVKSLQSQLMNQSGIISSQPSEIDARIQNAISSLKTGTEASNKAAQSQFERNAGYLGEQFNQDQQAGRAAGSGGIMNMAALRSLTDTTDKSLKDLAQRKEELVLQNNAAAASKIAELEISALDYKQKATQQVFNNLLGMANFANQTSSEERLSKQQSFQERSTIAEVGLKYGVPVGENDTIESIVAKAAPMASKQQQAELARTLAETQKIKADTQKILSGAGTSSDFSNPVISSLAETYLRFDPNSEDAKLLRDTIPKNKIDFFYDEATRISSEKLAAEKQASIDAQTSKIKQVNPFFGSIFTEAKARDIQNAPVRAAKVVEKQTATKEKVKGIWGR